MTVHAPLDRSTSQSMFSSAQNVESRNSASSCLGSSCPGNMHWPSSDNNKLGAVADPGSVAVPARVTSLASESAAYMSASENIYRVVEALTKFAGASF